MLQAGRSVVQIEGRHDVGIGEIRLLIGPKPVVAVNMDFARRSTGRAQIESEMRLLSWASLNTAAAAPPAGPAL
jgi:hypothetical protein